MTQKRVILSAIDFSETSDRALRQAHSLAKALEKDLHIIHVIEDSGGWFRLVSKEQHQIAEESIRDQMVISKLKQIINQVVTFIGKDDIDMTLIMTQPELGMLDFFISASALEMRKKSSLPVMSVQPKNLEQTSIFSF